MRRRERKPKRDSSAEIPVEPLLNPEERRLRFVHENRQRLERVAGVGTLTRAVFNQRCADGPAWRRQLKAVIEEHAGPELLSKIDGMEVRKGVLRLEVAEPATRAALGFEWQQRLLAIMQIHLPSAGINAVRFVMGRAG
jgi:hypothetical protein